MTNFLCPVCKKTLAIKGRDAVCPNGHLFDCAKEGYFYLLPPKSNAPGDNAEMVRARRDFLDCDFYAPLADAIASEINSRFANRPINLLDAGAGTGYYLSRIIEARRNESDVYAAVDISKNAVKICAKRAKQADVAVASVYDIPVKDEFADVVVCVFSPFAMDEYARVLKSGGILVLVYPCENHLIELRRALYDDVRKVETDLPSSTLSLLSKKEVTYSFNLESSKQISDLLTMTPYVYRAPKDKVECVKQKNDLSLTADFCLCTLEKTSR